MYFSILADRSEKKKILVELFNLYLYTIYFKKIYQLNFVADPVERYITTLAVLEYFICTNVR